MVREKTFGSSFKQYLLHMYLRILAKREKNLEKSTLPKNWFVTYDRTVLISFKNLKILWWMFMLEKKMYISYLCGQVSLNNWNVGLIQFSAVTHLCLTLCDPMDCSTPGLPVHHQLPEFAQTHVRWVSDAIQPPHPLSFPSLPALAWLHNQKRLNFFSHCFCKPFMSKFTEVKNCFLLFENVLF